MSLDINVNAMDYVPRFQTDLFDQLFTSTKISYLLLFVGVVIAFVVVFAMFGQSTESGGGSFVLFIEVALWVVFIYVIVVNIQHMDYNFTTKLKDIFNSGLTQLDIYVTDASGSKSTKDKDTKDKDTNDKDTKEENKTDKDTKETKGSCDNITGEVFHIPNNLHSYEEARKICSQYDSRLATYSEVEDAYMKGANWCSYGWSEDQLALFPTQLEIYNRLKKIPGHEHDCGRPGVNGGFIDNVNVRFGVNCYGPKPEQTDEDAEYMERLKLSYSPAIDPAELAKIEDEKNKLIVSPFNKDKWNI